MKRVVIIGLSLALALAVVATVAMAWGPGFGRGFGFGPPFANLTTEQSAQIQALQQANLKKIAPLQQELFAKGMELRSVWASPNPDQAVITAKQKVIFDLRSRLQEKAYNLGLEMQKVVPPEQRGTFGPGPGFGPPFGSR
ncbi:MAG: periplasmic heavy metal sensor [Deltaproteobacteria bacterium]|nr:periplasmic heavy metal sensor [Deltaproteobacteria bacterium]